MKTYMALDGLRWSRDSGSANCDIPRSAVFGRPGGGKIEALVNMEDFYKMLDSINPHILTDYIYMRLKHKQ